MSEKSTISNDGNFNNPISHSPNNTTNQDLDLKHGELSTILGVYKSYIENDSSKIQEILKTKGFDRSIDELNLIFTKVDLP